MMTLANMEGEESFEPSFLGNAEEVATERICDDELIIIKGWGTNNKQVISCFDKGLSQPLCHTLVQQWIVDLVKSRYLEDT